MHKKEEDKKKKKEEKNIKNAKKQIDFFLFTLS
jgi:hypothetical protein